MKLNSMVQTDKSMKNYSHNILHRDNGFSLYYMTIIYQYDVLIRY